MEEPKKRKKNEVYQEIESYLSSCVDLRFNIYKRQLEYRYLHSMEYKNLTDKVENSLYMQMKEDDCFKFTRSEFDTYMNSDRIRSFNPLVSYLNNLPKWDGVDYFLKLSEYIQIDNIDILSFWEQFKKWFLRLIKCALEPKYYNKQMIVFIGEGQNMGKTSFCKWLCPDELTDYFSSEDSFGKDELIQLASNLFILNDELAKLGKQSLDELKALFSKKELKFRPPYGRREESFERICSFIATSNKEQFLTDETGSVRFICGSVRSIDWQGYTSNIDINKLWAQAFYLYKQKYSCELTKEESDIIQQYNRRFYVTTTEEDFLVTYFRRPNKADYNSNTTPVFRWQAGQILQYLQDNIPGLKFNAYLIGKTLKFLGYERRHLRVNGVIKQVYELCLNYPELHLSPQLSNCRLKKSEL